MTCICHGLAKIYIKLNFATAKWGSSGTLRVQILQKKNSCLKMSKMYSPSVFFKDRLMLSVFESLKWKAKI